MPSKPKKKTPDPPPPMSTLLCIALQREIRPDRMSFFSITTEMRKELRIPCHLFFVVVTIDAAFEINKMQVCIICPPPSKVMRKETSRNTKSKHTSRKALLHSAGNQFDRSRCRLAAGLNENRKDLETVIHSSMAMGKEPGLDKTVNLPETRRRSCSVRRGGIPYQHLSMQTFSIAFRCVWIPSTTVFYVDKCPIS